MIVRVAHIQYALSQLLASSGLAPVLGPFNQNPPLYCRYSLLVFSINHVLRTGRLHGLIVHSKDLIRNLRKI